MARSSGRTDGPPVRLEAAAKRFGEAAGAFALEDTDLRVPKGRVVALAGANGSGKTTLLRLVAGDLRPTSGTVRVFGEDPASRPASLRSRIAYVTQSLALDPEMRVAESLALFAALSGIRRRARASRIEGAAETFRLASHLEKRVSRLSGGLKRRLHIAIGLLGEPELILLDEPAAGLDPEGQELLWSIVEARRAAGAAVLVSTHDPASAEKHADRLLLLRDGRIVSKGAA